MCVHQQVFPRVQHSAEQEDADIEESRGEQPEIKHSKQNVTVNFS
jgi:hypothetical protein